MTEFGLANLVALPIGLGLFGFVEPCSIGSTLVFIKYLEGKGASEKLAQVAIFTITRALFIGLLGVLAVLVGAAFVGLQKGAWVLLGAVYVAIGVLYLTGRAKALMLSLGPSLGRISGSRGSVSLGLLFGLNIPACAAPLIFALLGAAAAAGIAGTTLAAGFVSLGLLRLCPFPAARCGCAVQAGAAHARSACRLVGTAAVLDRHAPGRAGPLVDRLRPLRRSHRLADHDAEGGLDSVSWYGG